MARPKKDLLPANMYSRGDSYTYRLPDGRRRSLGKDLFQAVQAAAALNIEFDTQRKQGLLDDLCGNKRVCDVIEEFEPVKARAVVAYTMAEYVLKLRRIDRTIGTADISTVSVRDLDEMLVTMGPTYGTYKQYRSLLSELFSYAIAKGYRNEHKGNPGKALLVPRLARTKKPVQRQRLTRELYDQIRDQAPTWFRAAMDIALQTGLRRTDIAGLRWSQWDGAVLSVVPQKTKQHPNPPALAIKAGPVLIASIESMRTMVPVNSRFIIHRQNSQRASHQKNREDAGQVTPEQLTRAFAAYRKKVTGMINPPTFHEMRSLSARLYEAAGREGESVQLLLGHSDIRMTEHYQHDGSVKWQETWADL
tara:strand:+ start:4148 stop:5236 length:1089 start_codon:yes stop_codon:yes gene_type:complete